MIRTEFYTHEQHFVTLTEHSKRKRPYCLCPSGRKYTNKAWLLLFSVMKSKTNSKMASFSHINVMAQQNWLHITPRPRPETSQQNRLHIYIYIAKGKAWNFTTKPTACCAKDGNWLDIWRPTEFFFRKTEIPYKETDCILCQRQELYYNKPILRLLRKIEHP